MEIHILIMLRTNTLELKPTKQQQRILKELLVRSSAIWNVGNYEKRKAFFNNHRKIPSYPTLCKELKDHELYKLLGSAYSQQMLKKLEKSWYSFWQSLKSEKIEHKVSIPSYFKNYKSNQTLPKLLICRNDCYRIDDNIISISCSKDLKKDYRIKGLMKIRYNGLRKWKGKQKSMEIKYIPYSKKFYAYQTVEVEPIPLNSQEANICSIDLGIKRYITAYIKNSEDFCLLYESEHIFKNYLTISKKISYYQTIAKIENNKYSTHRIRRLYLKRQRKLNNYLNNILAHLFKKLHLYQISTIIIGDLKGIRDSKIPEPYRNKKKINKMIHNFWSYHFFLKKIQDKCEEYRINLILTNESHTSSTCPICNRKASPNDRIFLCPHCGYRQDRDVVGSINIISNYNHDHQIDDMRVENYPIVSKILIES